MIPKEISYAIIEKLLETIKPYKIILFGSLAAGTSDELSDLDLLVVTDDEIMPRNYDENLAIHLKVSSALREFRRKIPIDLLVQTRPMHRKFIELNSQFSREILENGRVLYEKDHRRVA
jgi:predicted nucleotidyltransferase